MSTSDEQKERLAKQLLQRAGLGKKTRNNSLPKLPELCEAILKEWGGFQKFAAWIFHTAEKASPQQRGRIADSILRLLEKNSDKGGAGGDEDDLSVYSRDDLARAAAELMEANGGE